jgi:hypothetical protein
MQGCEENPSLMKGVLADTIEHPGYALYMIQKEKLHHMVHVNCEADNSAGKLERAQFIYLVDFITRTFWVQRERLSGKYRWEQVPLLERAQLKTVQKFEIFERAKATGELMRKGPNYDARSGAKDNRKARVEQSEFDEQGSEQEGGVPL